MSAVVSFTFYFCLTLRISFIQSLFFFSVGTRLSPSFCLCSLCPSPLLFLFPFIWSPFLFSLKFHWWQRHDTSQQGYWLQRTAKRQTEALLLSLLSYLAFLFSFPPLSSISSTPLFLSFHPLLSSSFLCFLLPLSSLFFYAFLLFHLISSPVCCLWVKWTVTLKVRGRSQKIWESTL